MKWLYQTYLVLCNTATLQNLGNAPMVLLINFIICLLYEWKTKFIVKIKQTESKWQTITFRTRGGFVTITVTAAQVELFAFTYVYVYNTGSYFP